MGRKRSKRAVRKTGFWQRWWGLLWKLAVVGLVLLAGLAVYLDAVVQEKFSGKRWAVPAKVFARPVAAHSGRELGRAGVVAELSALGCRSVPAGSQPGQMSVAGNRVDVHTRGFQSSEGTEPAQRLSVRFSGQQVTGLSGNGDVVMARVEPLMIGGIYPAHNEDRILIRLDQAPPYLVEALVAVEDREFFQHFGISPKGIARAAYVNIAAGGVVQGGSTLTQQLVKNFYLNSERSLVRKGTEAIMAVLLE